MSRAKAEKKNLNKNVPPALFDHKNKLICHAGVFLKSYLISKHTFHYHYLSFLYLDVSSIVFALFVVEEKPKNQRP